ncbi:MAG: heparinase II/III family protein [Spirochaetaceae bacterium]|nr:heparinase II/III family protein [Spirochaetaceae bacterium]
MKHAPNATPYDVPPDAVAADGGQDTRSEGLPGARRRNHPFLLVTAGLLGEIAEKCRRHDWARENLRSMERLAQRWQPPELERFKIKRKGFTWYGLTRRQTIEDFWQTALVCKLTGSPQLRDKVLTYLRRIADPDRGYPTTRWATDSTAYVHEGEFFTFYPAVYDLMYDDLSRDDHAAITETLRLYLRTCEAWHDGGTGNWSVTANTGAILSSLALGDVAMLDRFMNIRSGYVDQLSKGVMGDGWWLEGASNYGYLVARYLGYAAEACHNQGIDLFHLRVPSRPGHLSHDDWPNGWMGMNFDGWGPPGGPDRGLKDLHDGPIPMMDHHGFVVANSDSHKLAPGDLYELAYYRYRDPAYVWILAHTDRTTAWQSLVWGVPKLPEAADPRANSSHADNVGITALRSRTPGRDAADQIQAYVKWGIHGGWHGHFDRTALLALSRHGTEFFSPLASWFGYESPLYKAWVQPSISHNVVVVDGLQQEPVRSEQLLFHAGQALQACVVETRARWAQKKPWDVRNPGDLDPHNREKMIDYGKAAPVTQRRLAAVTDDYVVIADCLQAPVAHAYDWLMHPIGFRGAHAAAIRSVRHSDRLLDDPAGSYHHVTDCDWFEARSPLVHSFRDGSTLLAVHSVWPATLNGTLGTFPFPTAEVSYRIDGDGRYLADGGFVANAFDAHAIDVDVTGVNALRLAISLDMKAGIVLRTHALGDPRFVTAGGGTVHLADVPFTIAGSDGPMTGSESTRPTLGAHGRRVDLTAAGHRVAVTVDTASLDSARFVANLADDGQIRDMTAMRRTLLLRQHGKEARFLNVLEPFRNSAAIRAVHASGPDDIQVSLADGRVHSIELTGLEAGTDLRVSLREHRNGALIREETTA